MSRPHLVRDARMLFLLALGACAATSSTGGPATDASVVGGDGGAVTPDAGTGGRDAAALSPDARRPGAPDAEAKPPAEGDAALTAPDARAPGAFVHPGVLSNRAQLDFVRAQVKAGAVPWKPAYDKALARSGSLAYEAQPFAVVECGSHSKPDLGCSPELDDAVAAYTHALAWYVTGDQAHARKAIEIMNAWAATLKSHTNSNAPLQTGWGGALWPLGAEIIRWTYDGWAAADVAAFSAMLKKVYLPVLLEGSGSNGNWELVMIEAAAKIAVFLDDRATFDKALGMWRRRLPAYFYLKSDGPTPVLPPGTRKTPAQLIAYWQGQTTYADGLAQETCRDFGHTQYGLASALAVAETAFQQGVDLYAEESARLRAAMEFHADFMLGKAAPSWLCGGMLTSLAALPTWEVGYNHFQGRMGVEMPRTKQLIETKVRALASGTLKHIVWETLSHAGTGRRGFP